MDHLLVNSNDPTDGRWRHYQAHRSELEPTYWSLLSLSRPVILQRTGFTDLRYRDFLTAIKVANDNRKRLSEVAKEVTQVKGGINLQRNRHIKRDS